MLKRPARYAPNDSLLWGRGFREKGRHKLGSFVAEEIDLTFFHCKDFSELLKLD